MFGNAQAVKNHRPFCLSVESGGGFDFARWNAGDRLNSLGRILFHLFGKGLELLSPLGDELGIV